jgi:hypothetical protein
MNVLEEKIARALTDAKIASSKLDELIAETQAAIKTVDATAEAERAKALDPAVSPDPKAARAAMEDAKFAADRLRTLLPRLEQRHQDVSNHEAYTRWASEFDAIGPRYLAAVDALRELYLELETKLVAALKEAHEVDNEMQRLANKKPYHLPQTNGDGRALVPVEFGAREIQGLGWNGLSLMRDLKIPKFADPQVFAWPPPQPSFALQVAAAFPILPRRDSPLYDAAKRAEIESSQKDVERRATEARERYLEDLRRQAIPGGG